jgi:hypothetical protein
MKRLFVFLVAIALAGCLPEKANDLADCQTEADHFYQTYQAFHVDDPRTRYIIGCMAAKGYDLDVLPTDCDSQHRLVTQAACYTPNSWIARLIDRFRTH